MRVIRKLTVAAVAAGTCLVVAAVPAAVGSTAASSGFVVVASPNVGAEAELSSVAAVSPSDVWAVGAAAGRNLVEHWTGSAWNKVAVPHPGTYSGLNSVSVGGGQVWAVGASSVSPEVYRWTGNSFASVGGLPYGGDAPDILFLSAVRVFSATNAWVGGEDVGGSHELWHWNGASWTQITALGFIGAADDYITAIAGTATHVVVTGQADGGDGSFGVMYREGKDLNHWQSLAGTSGDFSMLTAASSDASRDAWSVGSTESSSSVSSPIAFHWDGSSTTQVTVPSFTTDHAFAGVAAVSPTNVWAVGYRASASLGTATLIDHFTGGSSFTDLGGPNVAGVANALNAIAEVPGAPSNLWAVGSAGSKALILHHS
jgi:hypothetical protein